MDADLLPIDADKDCLRLHRLTDAITTDTYDRPRSADSVHQLYVTTHRTITINNEKPCYEQSFVYTQLLLPLEEWEEEPSHHQCWQLQVEHRGDTLILTHRRA